MGSAWIWIILGVLLILGIIALVKAGAKEAASEGDDLLTSRLIEVSERGEVTSLEDIELSQPFQERVIVPMLLKIGEISARFTPQHLIEDTELKIELAGNPIRMGASTFLASRFVVAAVFGGLLLLLSLVAPDSTIDLNPFVIVPLFTIIGFYFR
jgi:tight adherence protein C